ncbi:fatty acyl-AMP ligase [Acidisoma silvae]|uniref:Fatty acyl-AMP ligase n=1 Tax=Acidisoma silvae TaxID=2802396 RepID=A0A964DYK6_9PROT|nr:fatty acyl-AMP ligase [Acidisoma silvae]MCB8875177.1 fatty acyl-AMP ligase [Acidisoma silvae]
MDLHLPTGPTPTLSGLALRAGDFDTLPEALDYAAEGMSGLNFYSAQGELGEALSYRSLRHDAVDLAYRLMGLGLSRGDSVAIIAETSPNFVRIFFACQYAGLVPVPMPLPFAFGGRETYIAHIERLADEAEARALFASTTLLSWLAPMAETRNLRFCGTVADLAELDIQDVALPEITPEDTAYLQFSSGSTRFPKGVVIQQKALMANAAGILAQGMEIGPEDRAVSWLPLYHDMGLVGFLLSPLAGQVTVDFIATQDFARRPRVWLSLISQNRGTISYSPSFGFDLCTRRQKTIDRDSLDLSCWRIAGIGGDMIRPAVLSQFAETFGVCGFKPQAFLPSYGMAEATLAISFAPVGLGIETETIDLDRLEQDGLAMPPQHADSRARTVVHCGLPLKGHKVEVRGRDGAVLADRAVGRVFARGPSIMHEYKGRPVETLESLSGDGWLETGDLGYRIGETLVITGRAKDLIIINGRNIWPQDLEWTVERAVPQVRTGDCAAFSIEENGSEVLVVAVEARGIADAEAGKLLIEEVRGALVSHHGVDSRVVLVPPGSLPYTSSGKLSRAKTRQSYLTAALPTVAAMAA